MQKSTCNLLSSVSTVFSFSKKWVNTTRIFPHQKQPLLLIHLKIRPLTDINPSLPSGAPTWQISLNFFRFNCITLCSFPKKLNLSFGDVLSIQTTFDYYTKSPYYFGCTADLLLWSHTSHFWLTYHGYGIRYDKLMKEVSARCRGIALSKFNHYWPEKDHFPSYPDFINTCHAKMGIIFHILALYQTSNCKRNTICKKVHKAFMKAVDGAGYLMMNHSIGMMAVLGLLPLWLHEHAHIPVCSKYIK